MKARLLLSLLLLLAFSLGLCACVDPAPTPDGPGGAQGRTYAVSYYYDRDYDGIADDEPDEIVDVPENRRAEMLSLAPTVKYELEGWYRVEADGTMGDKWDVNDLVTEDVRLIANWTVREYTVHYYVDDFEAFAVTNPYGEVTIDPHAIYPDACEAITEWKAQLDEGKVFLGWQTEEGERWDFDTDVVTWELSLYAVFGDPA